MIVDALSLSINTITLGDAIFSGGRCTKPTDAKFPNRRFDSSFSMNLSPFACSTIIIRSPFNETTSSARCELPSLGDKFSL
jgi:hypothetical protein